MVAIERRSAVRLEPSGRAIDLHRLAGGELPGLLLVLAPLVLVYVLVAVARTGGPAPTEAVIVAGAAAGGAAPADLGFVTQLNAARSAFGVGEGSSLLHAARGLCLAAGLLSALLLRPLVRRLELGADAAAAAVIVAGAAPLALGLQPTVDPGALAGCWLVLAAVLGVRLRPGPATTAGAAVAVAVAVLTAPLVAAGLLALVAQAFVSRHLVPGERRGRRLLAAVLAAATGAVVAALTVVRTSSVVPSGTAVGVPAVAVTVAVGAVVVALAWRRLPELRPACSMAAVWLACALWTGPTRLTALLLVVPVLALLIGGLVGDAAGDRLPRLSLPAAGAVALALVSGVTMASTPLVPSTPSTYRPLARWLAAELDPGVAVAAGPLDRAELVAAGLPSGRVVAGSASGGVVTLVPDGAGCDRAGTPVLTMDSAGSALTVCAPNVDTPEVASAETGRLLVDNPAFELLEPARRALLDGRVDGRLVTVLAGAAVTHRLEVTDFPAVPGEPAGALRRSAVLAGIVPKRGDQDGPATASLRTYLDAQQPPFRPELGTLADGRPVVHFRLPAAVGPVPG